MRSTALKSPAVPKRPSQMLGKPKRSHSLGGENEKVEKHPVACFIADFARLVATSPAYVVSEKDSSRLAEALLVDISDFIAITILVCKFFYRRCTTVLEKNKNTLVEAITHILFTAGKGAVFTVLRRALSNQSHKFRNFTLADFNIQFSHQPPTEDLFRLQIADAKVLLKPKDPRMILDRVLRLLESTTDQILVYKDNASVLT